MSERFFPALLKHWRQRRGLSQLDLALHARVSARHVSFLETGRAQPSAGMIVRLLGSLDVPLRDQNDAMVSAGFESRYPAPALGQAGTAVEAALARMLERHEPYPMIVVSDDTTVLRTNRAAERLFARFVADPAQLPPSVDMLTMLFHPALMRPFVVDWEAFARRMLARLHRETLHARSGRRLLEALDRVTRYEGVRGDWQSSALSEAMDATFTLRLARDDVQIGFLIAVTTFASPNQVTLDELRIESCFPLDQVTELYCEELAAAP